ncbi:MAG: hypothetical protein HOK84_14160, partial [Bacteroidetes bacterium]|nr:hypothetical protein [Bacteroidota bacterium]
MIKIYLILFLRLGVKLIGDNSKGMVRYNWVIGVIAWVVLVGSGCEKLPVEGLPECLDQFGTFEPENKPDDGTVTFDFYE